MTNGQGILVVVSGFSGAGKGTLMRHFWKNIITMRYPFLPQPVVRGRVSRTAESIFL